MVSREWEVKRRPYGASAWWADEFQPIPLLVRRLRIYFEAAVGRARVYGPEKTLEKTREKIARN